MKETSKRILDIQIKDEGENKDLENGLFSDYRLFEIGNKNKAEIKGVFIDKFGEGVESESYNNLFFNKIDCSDFDEERCGWVIKNEDKEYVGIYLSFNHNIEEGEPQEDTGSVEIQFIAYGGDGEEKYSEKEYTLAEKTKMMDSFYQEVSKLNAYGSFALLNEEEITQYVHLCKTREIKTKEEPPFFEVSLLRSLEEKLSDSVNAKQRRDRIRDVSFYGKGLIIEKEYDYYFLAKSGDMKKIDSSTTLNDFMNSKDERYQEIKKRIEIEENKKIEDFSPQVLMNFISNRIRENLFNVDMKLGGIGETTPKAHDPEVLAKNGSAPVLVDILGKKQILSGSYRVQNEICLNSPFSEDILGDKNSTNDHLLGFASKVASFDTSLAFSVVRDEEGKLHSLDFLFESNIIDGSDDPDLEEDSIEMASLFIYINNEEQHDFSENINLVKKFFADNKKEFMKNDYSVLVDFDSREAMMEKEEIEGEESTKKKKKSTKKALKP